MRSLVALATIATLALSLAIPAVPSAMAAEAPEGTQVGVTLTEMAIKLSTSTVPAGSVTFKITNAGTVEHEFVILKTDIADDALPPNAEEPGKSIEIGHVDEVDPVEKGKTETLTVTLGPGNYVLVCNKPGHESAGMHAAFTVSSEVDATVQEMTVSLKQIFALAGPVRFSVSNTGTVTHELVILKTDIPDGSLMPRSTDPSKVQEIGDIGEVEDLAPGKTETLSLDLTAGHYVLICNQPAHYAAGMHIAFTVLPRLERSKAAAIDAALAARGVEDLADQIEAFDPDAFLSATGVVVTPADRAAIAAGILPRAVGSNGEILY